MGSFTVRTNNIAIKYKGFFSVAMLRETLSRLSQGPEPVNNTSRVVGFVPNPVEEEGDDDE